MAAGQARRSSGQMLYSVVFLCGLVMQEGVQDRCCIVWSFCVGWSGEKEAGGGGGGARTDVVL